MLRAYFSSIILLLSSLAFAASASAQVTYPPKADNLPDGDQGWCTALPVNAPYDSDCGFRSYSDACEAQISSYYPQGSRKYAGSDMVDENRYTCKIEWVDPSISEAYVGSGPAWRDCSGSFKLIGGTCRIMEVCTDCVGKEQVGNPINVITGEKKQTVTDFATADGLMSLTRHYNSAPYGKYAGMRHSLIMLGNNWSFANLPVLWPDRNYSGTDNLFFSYADGYAVQLEGENLLPERLVAGHGAPRYSAEYTDGLVNPPYGTARTIAVTSRNGTIYNFELPAYDTNSVKTLQAKLVSADFGSGYHHTYDYYSHGKLKSITDTFGRTMEFSYKTVTYKKYDALGNLIDELYENISSTTAVPVEDEISLVDRVTLPDGTYVQYSYDALSAFDAEWDVPRRLGAAHRYTAADQLIKSESYHYDDDRLPFALTGITDDAGIRYASWTYDNSSRANSSEHAGGVNRFDIEYSLETRDADPSTHIVTGPLGYAQTYNLEPRYRLHRIKSVNGEANGTVAAETEIRGYSTLGLKQITDGEGKVETMTRNDRGLITAQTYGAGSADAASYQTDWHSRFSRPTQTVEPGLTTDYVYDAQGRVITMTQTDTSGAASAPRTWTYTWFGPYVSSVDGPLPGAGDTVFFSHIGELMTEAVNELGHVTQITAHNKIGAPATLVDPNGVVTNLAYDDRDRLRTITVDGQAVTTINYSNTDLVTSVTPPNGAALYFEYDDARRLMAIRNAVNDRIEYTRNAAGGITSTTIRNGTGGTAEFSTTAVRDAINRVTEAIGAGATGGLDAVTQFAYDKNDNVTGITDPRNNNWQQQFDGLDRLAKEIDPLGGETDYDLSAQMDGRNPLTGVTDARGVTTNYIRNGFGEVIREVSLEAGTTEYVRDERGLIIQMTDARGIVSDYTYDDAGRLLTVSYPSSPVDDIAYTYDEGSFGIGQLTTVVENFGTTTYSYDSLGHMTGMTRSILGQSYDCTYEYDLAGEVIAIVYPSGRRVTFERDAAARITAVKTIDPATGTETTIAGGITYLPFGPVSGLAMGDGNALSLTYDLAYRALTLRRSGLTGSLMDLSFDYDAAGDILAMNDNVRPDRSQSFAYDPVSRLTQAVGGYGTIDYAYNLGGDRTQRAWTKDTGTETEDYAYDGATARLMTVSLTDAAAQMSIKRQFDYAPSGQLTSDTRADTGRTNYLYTYGINARGRMASVAVGGTHIASYTYDESEQRIAKATGTDVIHYHYDHEGRLISETDGHTGETIREYIWLGLTPLAVIVTEEVTTGPGNCDEDLIAALTAELAAANSAADVIEAEISEHESTLAFREQKIAEMNAQLDNVSGQRREALLDKIEKWEAKIDTLDGKIDNLTSDLAAIYAEIGQIEVALAEAQSECDGGGTETGTGTYYLHADHLGKPQIATDSSGAIVWDGGITTPFGESVALAGAFAQSLMFPGQYADMETALNDNTPLFHNWHRTYDPTLGRYLQSDPIGLAGGINRYAYVGGNPLSWIDPAGLDAWIVIDPKGAGKFGHALLFFEDGSGQCWGYEMGARNVPSAAAGLLSFFNLPTRGGGTLGKIKGAENGCGIPNSKYHIKYETSPETGDKILECAKGTQEFLKESLLEVELLNKKIGLIPRYPYNIWANNCGHSVTGILGCAGVNVNKMPVVPAPILMVE